MGEVSEEHYLIGLAMSWRRSVEKMGLMYEDSRGWRYKVMAGLGTQFKARYLKPKACGWHCVKVLPWRDSIEEAENDLIEYAKKKQMKEV